MKLLRLVTNGVRGLPDRTYELSSRGTGRPLDRIVITGPARSGKTSFLQAIIAVKDDVGPYGARRPGTEIIRAGLARATIEATWALSLSERRRVGAASGEVITTSVWEREGQHPPEHDLGIRDFFRTYSLERSAGKVEYFHAERAIPRGLVLGDPISAEEGRFRLLPSDLKYRSIRRYLVDLAVGDAMVLDKDVQRAGIALSTERGSATRSFSRVLAGLSPDLAFEGVEGTTGGPRLRFALRDGTAVDLDELSASDRQGVLFAATFEQLALNNSIVLVDEPELHLDPRDHGRFFRALGALGADNQVISATSSAPVLGEVPRQEWIDLGQ